MQNPWMAAPHKPEYRNPAVMEGDQPIHVDPDLGFIDPVFPFPG